MLQNLEISLLYAYQCGKRRLEAKETRMTEHLAKPLKTSVFHPAISGVEARHRSAHYKSPVKNTNYSLQELYYALRAI